MKVKQDFEIIYNIITEMINDTNEMKRPELINCLEDLNKILDIITNK